MCGLWMQNSDFWTGITSLYVSQTSPVVLCMYYSVISNRITCLYISHPFSLVFACKTATFGAELQVSMGPRPHLSFLDAKQRLFDQNNKSLWVPDLTCRLCMQYIVISIRITCLYGSPPSSLFFDYKAATELLVSMSPHPYLWFCACKTATLGPDIQVCMGPRPHLLI